MADLTNIINETFSQKTVVIIGDLVADHVRALGRPASGGRGIVGSDLEG